MRSRREPSTPDHYAVLGVRSCATFQEIRAAYRRRARESHPDMHPNDPRATRRMAELNAAARVLLDGDRRRNYDHLRQGPRGTAGRASRAAWYDAPSDGDVEWSAPSAEATRGAGAARDFSGAVRPRASGVALSFQDALLRLGGAGRLGFAALCVVLGCGLVACARPSNAFWLPEVAATDASPSPWPLE